MVHEQGSALAQKILDGEYLGKDGALARGLAEYRADKNQAKWASTLLSALGRLLPRAKALEWEALRVSVQCFSQLEPLVAGWRDLAVHHKWEIATRYSPDECDVIASALLMRYRVPWASGTYAIAVEVFAKSAYERTKDEKGAHTPALAALTMARVKTLHFSHTHRHAAQHRADAAEWLAQAQYRVAAIADPNQKSRVLRGIADVVVGIDGYTHNALLVARSALDEADKVHGIAPDVGAKNEAMRKRIGF